MTRRSLLASLSFYKRLPKPRGRSLIRLEAIAAAQLPHTLSIRTSGEPPVRGQLVELRAWQFPRQSLNDILSRHGVRPMLSAHGGSRRVDLIPFEDLATRARAWSAFAADEEWIRLRQKCKCAVSGIALYRAL